MNSSNNEPTKYSSLASQILSTEEDLEKVEPYFEMLKVAINDDASRNLAITGAYGSGKSTILQTFFEGKHKHKSKVSKEQIVYISLANFNESESGKPGFSSSIKSHKLENQLESNILQQLLYSVDPKKYRAQIYRE